MAEDGIFLNSITIETDNFQLYLAREQTADSFSRTLQFQSEDAIVFFESAMTDDSVSGSIRIDSERIQISKTWDFDIPDRLPNAIEDLTYNEDYSLLSFL